MGTSYEFKPLVGGPECANRMRLRLAPLAVALTPSVVERCRLPVSKPVLKVRLVSALETKMW
jgi:hypothetical protein